MSAVEHPAWAQLTLTESEYRRSARRRRWRRYLVGYAFILPYLLPFIVFLLIPAILAVRFSFYTGGLVDDESFVGFRNWVRAADDPELRTSVINTAKMVGIAIGIVFVLGIGLAMLLNRYRRFGTVYKLGFYFPLLAPPVIAGLIWQFVVNFDFGVVNLVWRALGGDPINILGTASYALLTIVALEVWRGLGFWTLFFLAGIQGVPRELLDASRVDGARGHRRFLRVTLPMLRPLLLFAVVIAIIANFQIFDSVFSLTAGGPALATSTVVWFIWRNLFAFQNTGLAYATSVGLLAIILALTALSFWLLGARRKREVG